MRVYVIGAGVSYTAGYPLGGELLGALRKHVDDYQVDYKKEWAELLDWLENNANPDLRLAYAQGRLEHIFTILDLTCRLRKFAPDAAFRFLSHEAEPIAVAKAEACMRFLGETNDPEKHRQRLFRVLSEYFDQRHLRDFDDRHSQVESLSVLNRFGSRLRPGDVLITFNYDALMERVLLRQRIWFPSDGYGFRVPLQTSVKDQTPLVEKAKQKITVLKLHGSIGWRPKPVSAANGCSVGEGASATNIGPDRRLNVEHETPIVLDPNF